MSVSLITAKLEMARRMMKASKLREEFNNQSCSQNDKQFLLKPAVYTIGPESKDELKLGRDIVWTEEQKTQVEKADQDIRRWGEVLNAMPQFSPIMSSWMLDVHGIDKTIDADNVMADIVKSLKDNNSAHVLVEKLGNFQKLIADFIKQNGFVISDSGGGSGTWHLGVPGTTGEIDRLCALLWNQFGTLAEEGVIYMERHYWGARFNDLYNDNCVCVFIEKHKAEYDQYCSDPDPVWSRI